LGINTQNIKRTQKLNTKGTNNTINRWANELNGHFSNEEVQMANKHEKMFNIFSHYGNASQNHIEILSQSSYSYHQQTNTQEHLYTVGRNLN
jgi:hypothetical protein